MNSIQITAVFSLIVQFVIGVIDVIGLRFRVSDDVKIFRTLLKIELTVQVIEFMIYLVLTFFFFSKNVHVRNTTLIRYGDWCLTTPVMLITLMAYLSRETSFKEFLKKYKRQVVLVVSMDLLMLVAGVQNELYPITDKNVLDVCRRKTWIYIGFFPFLVMFGQIYTTFKDSIRRSREKSFIFFWFFIIWTIYGLVAFGSYTTRNSAYNILDIFAKNITGLFLVWKLSKHKLE